MNNPNSFLTRVKEISKHHNVDGVNKLLESGWVLLAIEQRQEYPLLCTSTYYIMGRVRDNEEEQLEPRFP
jgi:hypothetical protein